jgi:hypothetical protein
MLDFKFLNFIFNEKYRKNSKHNGKNFELYLGIFSLMESLAELLNIMAINNNGVEAKGHETLFVSVHIMLQRCRL